MGYMRHHAIIITCWDKDRTEIIHNKARNIFGENVSEITPQAINGYCSFLIPPDGSKEGWPDSDKGNDNRRSFKIWLAENGGLYADWVEVQYGDDNGETKIMSHSDDEDI